MSLRNLFVVFEAFCQVHRTKDVGAIPVGLSRHGFQPHLVAHDYESTEFEVIRPKTWGRRLGTLWGIGSIAALRGRCHAGDVINLYHLSAKSLIQSIAIRLLLPKQVVIWLKLDMNTTDWSLRVAALIAGQASPRSLKEYVVTFAGRLLCATINIASAESSKCYYYVSRWPVQRTFHLPNGVFREEFRTGQSEREQHITCIARHGDPNKRSERLLAAFCRLNKPSWKLHLIGAVSETFTALYHETVRENPSMAERIILSGNVTDRKTVLAHLAKTKFFALLSMHEGFSLALLEAAGAGCICIATDVGGAADVLNDTGVLLPRDFTDEQLLQALMQVTDATNHDHEAFSARTIARFDWDQLLKEFAPTLHFEEAHQGRFA